MWPLTPSWTLDTSPNGALFDTQSYTEGRAMFVIEHCPRAIINQGSRVKLIALRL